MICNGCGSKCDKYKFCKKCNHGLCFTKDCGNPINHKDIYCNSCSKEIKNAVKENKQHFFKKIY